MTSAVERLRRGAGSSRAPVVLVALLVVALLAVAVLGWRVWSVGRLADAEDAALAVARERAVQITTYTHETFEEDLAWARDGATSSFAREYAEASAPVGAVAAQVEATAQGVVVEASASAEATDRVEVLMFVDQTITQGADGEQRSERTRVVMAMVRDDGQWLVDDVALR